VSESGLQEVIVLHKDRPSIVTDNKDKPHPQAATGGEHPATKQHQPIHNTSKQLVF
jgi:hypothetical protein